MNPFGIHYYKLKQSAAMKSQTNANCHGWSASAPVPGSQKAEGAWEKPGPLPLLCTRSPSCPSSLAHDTLSPGAVQIIGEEYVPQRVAFTFRQPMKSCGFTLYRSKVTRATSIFQACGRGVSWYWRCSASRQVCGQHPSRISPKLPIFSHPGGISPVLMGAAISAPCEDHECGVICQGLEIPFCLYSCAIFLQHQEERLVRQHQGIRTWRIKVSDALAVICSHRGTVRDRMSGPGLWDGTETQGP